MTYRGRLIQKFNAEIARLDTVATDAVDSGAGYDDDFRETSLVDDGSQFGSDARRELPSVTLPCQMEPDATAAFRQAAGAAADLSVTLVFHFKDLEDNCLVDSCGKPSIKQGDRLVAIYRMNGDVVEQFPNPPGMYVAEVRQSGFGLAFRGTPTRNLLMVGFRERKQGAP